MTDPTIFDRTLAYRVLGAAEGTYYGSRDVRYVPSKANDRSGTSFGLVQLDASQPPGRSALRAVLSDAERCGTISADQRANIDSRFTGSLKLQRANAAETAQLIALFSTAKARAIIDAHDSAHVDNRLTAVTNVMTFAAELWRDKAGKIYPRLSDPHDADYVELASYIMATLNKREDNAGSFRDFLTGTGVTLASGQLVAKLNRPPLPFELHQLQPQLKCWRGDNGSYDNLIARMKGVVPAHQMPPVDAGILAPITAPPVLQPLGAGTSSLDLRSTPRHRHGASGD